MRKTTTNNAGRLLVAENKKKCKIIHFRVTKDLYQKLEQVAVDNGFSVGTFCREFV